MEKAKESYVLKMDNIAKEYYGNRVLKGVKLHIRPGETLAVVGPSGGREWCRKVYADEYSVWHAGDSQHRRI